MKENRELQGYVSRNIVIDRYYGRFRVYDTKKMLSSRALKFERHEMLRVKIEDFAHTKTLSVI